MDSKFKLERLFWILVTYMTEITGATECLKNADIGWRTGNIYHCTDPELPECCEMFTKFTCCESPHVKHLREQLQLWGSVTAFVIVVAVAIVFLTMDIQFFSRPTLREGVDNFKSKFRRKKKDELKFTCPGSEHQEQPHCSKDNIYSDNDNEYKKLNIYSKT